MSGQKYPRVEETRNHKAKTSLTCSVCEEQAVVRQFIQVSWFRGDDECVDLCKRHKNSKDALKAYSNESSG